MVLVVCNYICLPKGMQYCDTPLHSHRPSHAIALYSSTSCVLRVATPNVLCYMYLELLL